MVAAEGRGSGWALLAIDVHKKSELIEPMDPFAQTGNVSQFFCVWLCVVVCGCVWLCVARVFVCDQILIKFS